MYHSLDCRGSISVIGAAVDRFIIECYMRFIELSEEFRSGHQLSLDLIQNEFVTLSTIEFYV